MTDEGFTLDHRTLAALAREVEEGDPIAWGGVRSTATPPTTSSPRRSPRCSPATSSDGVPRDRQLLMALATVVKLTVENFVLHQRLMREGRR